MNKNKKLEFKNNPSYLYCRWWSLLTFQIEILYSHERKEIAVLLKTKVLLLSFIQSNLANLKNWIVSDSKFLVSFNKKISAALKSMVYLN